MKGENNNKINTLFKNTLAFIKDATVLNANSKLLVAHVCLSKYSYTFNT